MQSPDAPELLQQAVELSEQPLDAMLDAIVSEHEALFPSDMLQGGSLGSRYKQWVNRQLTPRLAKLGDEGSKWWRIMTKVDLFKHPDEFSQILVFIGSTFFPNQENYFAAVALLVAIRRLGEERKNAP